MTMMKHRQRRKWEHVANVCGGPVGDVTLPHYYQTIETWTEGTIKELPMYLLWKLYCACFGFFFLPMNISFYYKL